MANKKTKGRVKQTSTEWQKKVDKHQVITQSISWSDRLLELVHISIALIDNDYQTVKKDFYDICDFVNAKIQKARKFHFNLTHTIKLIQTDTTILEKILATVLKDAFQNILACYQDLFQIPINFEFSPNPKLLFFGYQQILDGRSDTSILCKYLMVQYKHNGKPDPFGVFNWQTKEEVLEHGNISSIMASFLGSIGLSENLDLEMCKDIWMHNYVFSPRLPKSDDSKMEEEHYTEMEMEKFKNEFETIYSQFKELNLLAIYQKFIAEVNMGFVARICNLSLDIVDWSL